jgi:hypothetical protein
MNIPGSPGHLPRRSFLAALLPLAAVVLPWPLAAAHRRARTECGNHVRGMARAVVHPEPRPGITGARVLSAAKLQSLPALLPVFDGIREFAHLADGIGCYCGCADQPEYRSLLTCYEDGTAMAIHCEICQGQGKLLVRRAREGQTLAQIRSAIDARYGSEH